MKKYLLILFLLLITSQAFAGDKFTISGYLKNETAWRVKNGTALDKEKNIIQLAAQYNIIGDDLVFFMKTRYWYDAAYDIRESLDAAQHYMGHVQRTDWLRDCYIDFIKDRWFLRLGKQQVVWGQADGVAILDRVNPFDLTEYWLQDLEDMRIPLWMLNINYSPKLNSNLQLLIIPDFEQSTAAPPPAPFAFRSYELFEAFKKRMQALGNTVNANIYYPDNPIKIGVQWKDRIADWDYTLNYLYGYDYLARTYLDSVTVTPRPRLPPLLTFNYGRRFKIDHLIGGSFNHTFTREGPLEGITLRGDLAVYLNEPTYYGIAATGQSIGVNRWDNIFWLIGIDRYILTNVLASFQYGQYIMEHAKPKQINPMTSRHYEILNSYTNGAQDPVENIFTLKLSTDYWNERIKPEVLWSFTDDNQGRVSPKVSYEIVDNLVLTLGYHYFYGNVQDSNGQFRDQNEVYTMLKFSF